MELMYEYVSGTLDPRREQDIETFLPTDRECQRELDRLKRAMAYTQKAAHASVTPALHEALLKFEPQWQKSLREWTLWSSQRGWRALPYLFVVVTAAVGLLVTKPWVGADLTEVTLAEQGKVEPQAPAEPPAPNVAVPAVASNTPAPVIEGTTPPLNSPPAAVPTPATLPKVATPAPQLPGQTSSAVLKPEVDEGGYLPGTPAAKAAESKAAEAPVAETHSEVESSPPMPPIAKGEVQRAEISVSHFEFNWPAIREKIIALGGKSAGGAGMGSLGRDGHAYFQFSLPESNFSDLESFLSTFGPVRFEREKVSRVMPEGQIRIILTVKALKEAESTNEGSSETP